MGKGKNALRNLLTGGRKAFGIRGSNEMHSLLSDGKKVIKLLELKEE